MCVSIYTVSIFIYSLHIYFFDYFPCSGSAKWHYLSGGGAPAQGGGADLLCPVWEECVPGVRGQWGPGRRPVRCGWHPSQGPHALSESGRQVGSSFLYFDWLVKTFFLSELWYGKEDVIIYGISRQGAGRTQREAFFFIRSVIFKISCYSKEIVSLQRCIFALWDKDHFKM